MGGLRHLRRCCQGVSQGVGRCRLVDHGKLHKRHGLSAWGNLALCKGVLLTKNERGGGLGRRGVCGDLRAGDKAVRGVLFGTGISHRAGVTIWI